MNWHATLTPTQVKLWAMSIVCRFAQLVHSMLLLKKLQSKPRYTEEGGAISKKTWKIRFKQVYIVNSVNQSKITMTGLTLS